MSRAGFGVPKYGGGGNFKKTGSPAPDADTDIRIMPPMFSLIESGMWRQYHATHWGFAGVNSQDKTKTTMRPFRCILDKDFRTGMVRQECPACTQYEQVVAQAKEQEAEIRTRLKADGVTDEKKIAEALEAEMASINDWLKAHRIERKHYVNVMYRDGGFGDFKLNSKDHLTRIRAIIEGEEPKDKPRKPGLLEAKGIDPLDLDQGVWFRIHRTGKGFGTRDTVDIVYTEVEALVNGRITMVPQIEQAPLSEEQSTRALKECRDLTTLGGAVLDFNQIKALVECSGDPQEIDEIMGIKHEAKPATPSAPAAKFTPPVAKASVPAATPPTAKTATAFAPVAKPAAEAPAAGGRPPLSPAMQQRLAEIEAKRKADAEAKAKAEAEARAQAEAEAAAAAASEATADAPAENPGDDAMGMSDEDFLAFVNGGEVPTT